MRPPLVNAPIGRLIVIAALVAPPASSLQAQTTRSPIAHALYLALGGDPTSGDGFVTTPLALSAGVERTRAGSRWALRLGADYRRQSSNSSFGSTRSEDFGVSLTARYGRSAGAIRPYLLGGVGLADLRTRGRNLRYYIDPDAVLFPPQSYDHSRWNGSLTTGVGTDVTVGRLKLFTEARLNLYPGSLTTEPHQRYMVTRKALFLGVKF